MKLKLQKPRRHRRRACPSHRARRSPAPDSIHVVNVARVQVRRACVQESPGHPGSASCTRPRGSLILPGPALSGAPVSERVGRSSCFDPCDVSGSTLDGAITRRRRPASPSTARTRQVLHAPAATSNCARSYDAHCISTAP